MNQVLGVQQAFHKYFFGGITQASSGAGHNSPGNANQPTFL